MRKSGEEVVIKLRAGSMPPPGSPRPDEASYAAVAGAIEQGNRRGVGSRSQPGVELRPFTG